MSDIWTLRIYCKTGRSKILAGPSLTLSILKSKIKKALDVNESQQVLSFDEEGSKPLKGDSLSLNQLGLYNGCILYLISDEAAKIKNLTTVSSSIKRSTADFPRLSNSDPAKGENKNGKNESEDKPVLGKFKSFDSFLKDNGYNIMDLPLKQCYESRKLAQNQINRIPPSITLKHQVYRHVDHLEIMNVEEANNFVSYWRYTLGMHQQRCAWMYGYYTEDPNYLLGIRATVEAMYEPPQSHDENGDVILNDDPFQNTVNGIVAKLGMELIGMIFTHQSRKELLTSKEIIALAEIQLKNLNHSHYTGYPISTFVTCTIAPCDESNGEPVPNAFMVSDLGMAFLRDKLLLSDEKSCASASHLKIREPEKFELLPQVLECGKSCTQFDADWFVVRVNESAPKKPCSFFNSSSFPRENRIIAQTPADICQFLASRPADEPCYKSLNDFHLLLYLAKLFDLDTALTICDHIVKELPIDPQIVEILRSLA